MSRDFELLQRLEKERNRTSRFHDPVGRSVRVIKQNGTPEISTEHTFEVNQPGRYLEPSVRNEFTKLVLRTFLSTPVIRVAMFTGVEAKDGAKWVAACTADVLSDATRGRVCLLDADLASPTLHRVYSIPNHNGLAAVLDGSCPIGNATRRTGENLWVIPAGIHPANSQMVTAIFHEAIVDLLDHFEYLLISAPDYDQFAELGAIGAATEGAVLVLDAMTTRRVEAQRAKAALEMAKVPILGSVLNNRSVPVPDFLYSRM
jgi:Mrp family chromosome partitioning ATPase